MKKSSATDPTSNSPLLAPTPRPRITRTPHTMPDFVQAYQCAIDQALRDHDWKNFHVLLNTLRIAWIEHRQVFLCGNGGSAANAAHLANDLLYGIDKPTGRGLRVNALSANTAVLTCLANDTAYAEIYAQQLLALASPGDVLICFSGSGNSPNILRALEQARALNLTTFAVLGYDGGQALTLADHPIHFNVHNMQVAEDLQMVVGHLAMQWLSRHRP